ncbi:metallophosphoesterase family protein [Gorillibacterium massiliense]|uniref:metallophosphoesterase family protein n=1 Tax=Gorillibacterium massiliense TaxID=1280390 RepID=UPI0004BA3AD4|nr:metallophosphoesterase [Gorillibacterium massiliense]
MKIGVVSDTHMPHSGQRLPKALVAGLQGVDLILHAGDWTAPYVAELLEQIAPVDGVTGNNDGPDIYRQFGKRKLLTLGGIRIGIVHGDGFRGTTEERALAAFAKDTADVVIFGHSHIPYKQVSDGILLFNPGSPTDKRWQKQFSYGILEIGSNGTEATHYFYNDKS